MYSWIWRRLKAGETVTNNFDADKCANVDDMGYFLGQCLLPKLIDGVACLPGGHPKTGRKL